MTQENTEPKVAKVIFGWGKTHGSTTYCNASWGITAYCLNENGGGLYPWAGWPISGNKKEALKIAKQDCKTNAFPVMEVHGRWY